mmetsp:Transcript_28066/g.40642  ORF Transcript_28066/g.40642 Transcript_28066/m.40642 type:complete len:98 (+) Transcript_28066:408-701(+)
MIKLYFTKDTFKNDKQRKKEEWKSAKHKHEKNEITTRQMNEGGNLVLRRDDTGRMGTEKSECESKKPAIKKWREQKEEHISSLRCGTNKCKNDIIFS